MSGFRENNCPTLRPKLGRERTVRFDTRSMKVERVSGVTAITAFDPKAAVHRDADLTDSCVGMRSDAFRRNVGSDNDHDERKKPLEQPFA